MLDCDKFDDIFGGVVGILLLLLLLLLLGGIAGGDDTSDCFPSMVVAAFFCCVNNGVGAFFFNPLLLLLLLALFGLAIIFSPPLVGEEGAGPNDLFFLVGEAGATFLGEGDSFTTTPARLGLDGKND